MNDVLDKVKKQINDFEDSWFEDSLFSIADFFYNVLKCVIMYTYDGELGLLSDDITEGHNKLWELIVAI